MHNYIHTCTTAGKCNEVFGKNYVQYTCMLMNFTDTYLV